MEKIKAILWDIDDTLMDFLKAEKLAIQALFGSFQLGECTDAMVGRYSEINNEYWKKLERGECSKPEILRRRFEDFFEEFGVDSSLAEEFNKAYQVALGDYIVFYPDAKEVLERLKGKIWLGAVTNGTKVAQTKKLKKSGLEKLFDGIFISEDAGAEKPSKQYFDKVFQAMPHLEKDEILIVGDSLTSDMLGGIQAGIKTCWFNPKGKENDKGLKIDYEIKRLREVFDILRPLENVETIEQHFHRVQTEDGKETLGGSQEFFYPYIEAEDETKKKMGCGIVSLGDVLLHLAKHHEHMEISENCSLCETNLITKEAYRNYFNVLYAKAGGVSPTRGLTGLKLVSMFNQVARREGWKLRAHWCVGYGKMLQRIQDMLSRDIPVTLSIPVVFGKQKEEFPLLQMIRQMDGIHFKKKSQITAHYVTVLGVVVFENKPYLQISSWGRSYYIDFEEYRAFCRKQFLGFITGNMMYIRERKRKDR